MRFYIASKFASDKAMKSWPQEKWDELIALWNAGYTAKEIAARLETSTHAIHASVTRLRKKGIDLVRRTKETI
jgi:DNA-binding MarR family transcriptional regulator